MTRFRLPAVPCAPQNVSAIMDCSSDSITLTWTLANGALYYIGVVTDSWGQTHTCNTMDVNCQVTGLQCGTSYSGSVVSSNYKCNSSASPSVEVETGILPIRTNDACPKTNVLTLDLPTSPLPSVSGADGPGL